LNHEGHEGHEEKRNEVFIFISIYDFNHTTREERASPQSLKQKPPAWHLLQNMKRSSFH